MRSKFLAGRIEPVPVRQLLKAAGKSAAIFGQVLIQPLVPYQSVPQEPERTLPKQDDEPSDEQIAQCQIIFDRCEERCVHIEKKAQWTFTAFALVVPALASVLAFLFRDTAFGIAKCTLLLSACLLILSFISAARAIAIHPRQDLFIHSVLNEGSGTFRKYDKKFHALGLLHCAIRNTATNDHIAQFVKGAHILLTAAIIGFVLGVGVIGFGMSAHMATPTKTEIVGAVMLSPESLSVLHSDIREAVSAVRGRTTSTQNLLKLLSDHMRKVEKELWNLRSIGSRGGDTNPAL